MISMFTVTGKVLKTFIQPGVLDKETNQVSKESYKVQLIGEMPVPGDESKLELITLTIPDRETYDAFKGKNVRIPLGFFAPAKGNIVYFIPKGSRPEIMTDSQLETETASTASKPLFSGK